MKATEFDAKFDQGEDITEFLDLVLMQSASGGNPQDRAASLPMLNVLDMSRNELMLISQLG
ncbi:hypothetical protein BJP37_02970 [Moorena bouillonii PNG]|uniref:Uncharacterized protein n=1 Tax=Moorena bouillonii PNG TaxID=568701 RepID=A0A1U7MWS5_9CYAN|nr:MULTISPECIES: hypothetical protein [Moorena]OLT58156.1 hypothetical protein BJP37_02970 [Moorena bouillonii PNG]